MTELSDDDLIAVARSTPMHPDACRFIPVAWLRAAIAADRATNATVLPSKVTSDQAQASISQAELLQWRDAVTTKPDADIRALLWIAFPDGTFDWESGWFDGEDWLLCESGGVVNGRVLSFAQPEGPC